MQAHEHTPDEEAAKLDNADVGEQYVRRCRRRLHRDVRLNLRSLQIQMGLELE